jgi:hypothetical protein
MEATAIVRRMFTGRRNVHISLRHALAAMILMAGFGCQTRDESFARIINEPAPLPNSVRMKFGVMAVLPATSSFAFELARPSTKGEAMVHLHQKTFDTVRRSSERDYEPEDRINFRTGEIESRTVPIERQLEQNLASLLVSSLVSDVVGVFGGMLLGVPKNDVEEGQRALRKAVAEHTIENRFNTSVGKRVARRNLSNVVIRAASVTTNQAGLPAPQRELLAGEGYDSVLLTELLEQRFVDISGVNPLMTFAAGLSVQVVRVSDGTVIHSGFLDYRGRRMRFKDWTGRDARQYRREMSHAGEALAAALTEQLFSD